MEPDETAGKTENIKYGEKRKYKLISLMTNVNEKVEECEKDKDKCKDLFFNDELDTNKEFNTLEEMKIAFMNSNVLDLFKILKSFGFYIKKNQDKIFLLENYEEFKNRVGKDYEVEIYKGIKYSDVIKICVEIINENKNIMNGGGFSDEYIKNLVIDHEFETFLINKQKTFNKKLNDKIRELEKEGKYIMKDDINKLKKYYLHHIANSVNLERQLKYLNFASKTNKNNYNNNLNLKNNYFTNLQNNKINYLKNNIKY